MGQGIVTKAQNRGDDFAVKGAYDACRQLFAEAKPGVEIQLDLVLSALEEFPQARILKVLKEMQEKGVIRMDVQRKKVAVLSLTAPWSEASSLPPINTGATSDQLLAPSVDASEKCCACAIRRREVALVKYRKHNLCGPCYQMFYLWLKRRGIRPKRHGDDSSHLASWLHALEGRNSRNIGKRGRRSVTADAADALKKKIVAPARAATVRANPPILESIGSLLRLLGQMEAEKLHGLFTVMQTAVEIVANGELEQLRVKCEGLGAENASLRSEIENLRQKIAQIKSVLTVSVAKGA